MNLKAITIVILSLMVSNVKDMEGKSLVDIAKQNLENL